jgi:pentatricopeptide repeat protein
MAPGSDPLRLGEEAYVRQLEPDEWERLQTLFGELLEAADPEAFLAEPRDARLSEPLRRLWRQHQAAQESGFLKVPLVSVRSLAAVEPAFSTGQVLAGRFSIERLLGAGGMGEVYLSRDQRLDERVALKTIRRRLAADPDIRRRFVAEVQNARRVTHRNVCRIFELFDAGETPFLVMEYLDGPTLTEWLKAGRRPAAARRKIALDLAEGLAAAHANGIIHRDLKPDNVILAGPEQQPRAVITDFGLARPFAALEGPNALSLGGGTRSYMAPELLAGAPASIASDMYAFGVVLDQLLPGHRFAADCMARNPERRPKSLDNIIRQWRSSSSRRWWMLAWLAGPAAAVGAYEWMSRPRLAFTSRQRLVLNGFSPASDNLARTLRELLITGLRQSPLVAVVPDERIRALTGGAWPSGVGQLLTVARQAQIPFVLEGSLERVGAGLTLLIDVLDSVGGKRALRLSETGDQKRLVTLADRVELQLRRNFGESENSLRATYKSLTEVTSASPEAVEAYFQGVRLYEDSDADGALTWFDRAIEIDPQFALAHLRRALALEVNNRETEALDAYERAFQLRARVSERERLWIESQYANLVARDLLSAANILRRLVRLYPEEATFQRQLAFAYARLGKPQEGLEAARKAIELDSSSANNRQVLITCLAQAGRADEALDYFRQSRAEGIGSQNLERGAGLAYLVKGDYDAALAAFRRMTSPPELEMEGRQLACGPLVMQGRFTEAAQQLESYLVSDSMGHPSRHSETGRLSIAHLHWLMDQPESARMRASEAAQLDSLPINVPFLGPVAGLAFLLQDLHLLRQVYDGVEKVSSRWPSTYSKGTRALCEALFRWATDDARSSASFQEARSLWPDPLTLFWVARWQSNNKDFAGALATLEEAQAELGTLFRYHFAGFAVLGWIEEARCLRALSRFPESLRLYRRVLDQWGRQAGAFGVVREVHTEYFKLLQGEK